MSITNHSFKLDRQHDQAYRYTTSFHDQNGAIVSKKIVEFTQPGFLTETEGRIVDVYSQNGVSANPPHQILTDDETSHLFSGKDIKALNRAAKKIDPKRPTDRTVFVLDLQDCERTYLNPSEIQESESVVCNFMSKKEQAENLGKRAKRAHDIFHNELPIDYVLREGTLKTRLVGILSEEQRNYFLNTGTKGRAAFCEFTEPFINAMKLGHETREINSTPELITPISSPETFQPHAWSASTVLYPETYAELYAPNAPIPTALREVFSSLSMEEDTLHRITSMTISENGT